MAKTLAYTPSVGTQEEKGQGREGTGKGQGQEGTITTTTSILPSAEPGGAKDETRAWK